MRFTNSYSTHLGTYTWAELQAAYPNGGGALSALPSGAWAFVTDWSVPFFRNSGGTRWVTQPFTIYVLPSPVTVQSASETLMTQFNVPAALLGTRAQLRMEFGLADNGTTTSFSLRVRMGTAGTTSDALIRQTVTMGSAAQRTKGFTLDAETKSATAINTIGVERTDMSGAYGLAGVSSATRSADSTIPNLGSSANILSVFAFGDNATDIVTLEALRATIYTCGT